MPSSYKTAPVNKTVIPLESIRVAKPCHADWDRMEGDDRVRFCQSCTKNVYNLSSISRVEAEKLITEKEGKLCVQYYQRADGTILTDDCPIALRAMRRPFKWLIAGFALLLASGAAILNNANAQSTEPQPATLRWSLASYLSGIAQNMSGTRTAGTPTVKGDIAYPSPTPTPTPKPKPQQK